MTIPPTPSLRQSFRELATWTVRKIETANKYIVAFSEETITESLLLKLSENHATGSFKVRSWTKAEEGTGTRSTGGKPTGADWDFHFSDWTGLGITIRVQAKRHFRSGRYESLDGTGQQIKDLRLNCGATHPIYVFYNDTSNNWPLPKWLCDATCRPRFRGESVWGCSFAAVTAIPVKNKPSPSEIKKMLPWHCLVGPCGNSKTTALSLPHQVAKAMQSIYGIQTGKPDARFRGAPELALEGTMTSPRWATLLLDESDGLSDAINPHLIQNNLKGVAVIHQIFPEDIE